MRVQVFEDDQAKEAAKLALHHRLFVSQGWDLNTRLHRIAKGSLDAAVVIAFEEETPIGVAVKFCPRWERFAEVQVFVRKKHRRKGVGRAMFKKLNPEENFHYGEGLRIVSPKFWQTMIQESADIRK